MAPDGGPGAGGIGKTGKLNARGRRTKRTRCRPAPSRAGRIGAPRVGAPTGGDAYLNLSSVLLVASCSRSQA